MDLQPGDEVSIEAQLIPCEGCKKEKPVLGFGSFYVHTHKGQPVGLFCASCSDTDEKRVIPIEMIAPIMNDEALPTPIQGNFKPVETKLDRANSALAEAWKDRGHLFLETMVMWQGLVLKFSIGGNRYKGIWIKPTWDGRRVISLSFAGDSPSKGLELDIYQISRMKKLGLVEQGAKNKEWRIDLLPSEQAPDNAAGVMLHVLRQGYLMDPSDVYSVTPTLDIDSTAPEWRND
jgi:hypothetical protein